MPTPPCESKSKINYLYSNLVVALTSEGIHHEKQLTFWWRKSSWHHPRITWKAGWATRKCWSNATEVPGREWIWKNQAKRVLLFRSIISPKGVMAWCCWEGLGLWRVGASWVVLKSSGAYHEGDWAILALSFSTLLLPGHEVFGFSLPHTPAVMIWLITGLKQ